MWVWDGECDMWMTRAWCGVRQPFNRLELLARVSTQLRVTEASRVEVENALSTRLLERMLPKE
eukprot:1933286-Rhodomonas_salina.7